MKIFSANIGGIIKSTLLAYGAFGLFLIALLDAAFIPLPGGPDVVVIALSHHSHAFMPFYVIVAVIGSTLGSLLLYWMAMRSGGAALRRFSAEKRERAMRLISRYDISALLVAAILPPPFPFKLIVLSAGAFQMRLWRFVIAIVVGRGFRFALEGIAAVYYGEEAVQIFKQYYPKIGLSVAATILVIFLGNSLLRKRRPATP